MKKYFLILAAVVMTTTGMNAQTATQLAKQQLELNAIHMKMVNAKPSKAAKKQAKELKKAGWTEPAGEQSMEQQITISQLYGMEQMVDASGVTQRRFIQETGQQAAGSYNAAYAAARAAAQTELAAMIQTELVAAWQQKLDNAQTGAASAITNDQFNQRVKAVIDQTLSNCIPVLAIYRRLPNNNFEVQVRIAYDKQTLMMQLRQNLQKELQQEGDELEEIVDEIIEKKF